MTNPTDGAMPVLPDGVWPDELMIRDTGIHDDAGGLGQRIYTTAGAGYARVKYVRAETVQPLVARVAELEADAARWRRLVNASELPFPTAAIADDPENDARMVYGRKRLEELIDLMDEIPNTYEEQQP